MVTLTLKKKPGQATAPSTSSKRPLRSSGYKARPTLAQAQEERRAREAEFARAGDRQRDDAPRRGPFGRDGRPEEDWRGDARTNRTDRSRPPLPARTPPADPRGPSSTGPRSVANRQMRERLAPATVAPTRPAHPSVPSPSSREALVDPTRPMDGDRLSKRMTALGLASRREADAWIEAGWVRVNGEMAVLGQRVHESDRIEVDPAAHREQAKRVTILLNKPVGFVSGQPEDGYEAAVTLVRPENHWNEDRSGKRWHPGHLRGLAPAGRLDIDSVGLLVLTQDGRLAKALIGDDSKVEKEYLVRVVHERGGRLSEQELALLNHGLELDGRPLRPAKVSWQNEDQLRFVLREGKKRQIRRMCAAVGLKVVGLKRVRIGSVVLGKLPPGQWRYLRDDEFFG